VPDDAYICAAALLDILVFARSSPAVEDLLAFFVPHALSVLDCDKVEVRRGGAGECAPDAVSGSERVHVSCHPVSCGSAVWGELHLTYRDGPLAVGEVERGRVLAEVLGAALASAGADAAGAARAYRDAAALDVGAAYPDADQMTALVLDSAEALDRMPAASTRARLTSWRVRLAAVRRHASPGSWRHARGQVVRRDLRRGVRSPPTLVDGPPGRSMAPPGRCGYSDYPALRRASEGGPSTADQWCGDDTEALRAAGGRPRGGRRVRGVHLDGRSMGGPRGDSQDRGCTASSTSPPSCPPSSRRRSASRARAVVPRPMVPWVRPSSSNELPRGPARGPVAAGIGAVGECLHPRAAPEGEVRTRGRRRLGSGP
jgi:hypothetical protein